MKSSKAFVGLVAALVITTGLAPLVQGCSLIPTLTPSPTPSVTVTPAPIDAQWSPPSVQTAQLQPDLSTLVAEVSPSVVSINVKVTLLNIFGQSISQEGAGSGWIIDSNGLIVTNNHVVAGAKSVEVTLSDGRVYRSVRVVTDPVSDLAVVKIDATGLPAAQIGDSSQMKVGMKVAAIGNALGQGLSMTAGWISRLGASVTISSINETLYDLIETSTPINPGNSGGPLINMAGQVIGITNAKLVSSSVENIGYAISMQNAMPIIEQLIRKGYVVRPYFGVALQTVNAGVAAVYGLPVNTGALITGVAAGSPASNAGLQTGDVIVQVDGMSVASASQAADALGAAQIGQKVKITFWRSGSQYTAEATPIQNPQL